MKEQHPAPAPDKPGDEPRWTTGAKTAVGTAVSLRSWVWFTIAHGIVNEIYFPSIDQANLRVARFLRCCRTGIFSDEECDAEHSVQPSGPRRRRFWFIHDANAAHTGSRKRSSRTRIAILC